MRAEVEQPDGRVVTIECELADRRARPCARQQAAPAAAVGAPRRGPRHRLLPRRPGARQGRSGRPPAVPRPDGGQPASAPRRRSAGPRAHPAPQGDAAEAGRWPPGRGRRVHARRVEREADRGRRARRPGPCRAGRARSAPEVAAPTATWPARWVERSTLGYDPPWRPDRPGRRAGGGPHRRGAAPGLPGRPAPRRPRCSCSTACRPGPTRRRGSSGRSPSRCAWRPPSGHRSGRQSRPCCCSTTCSPSSTRPAARRSCATSRRGRCS